MNIVIEGLNNDAFGDFHERMASFSEARHKKYLISDYLPLTGMKEKLEKGGIHVLDVGCGRGVHAAEFGKLACFAFYIVTKPFF